MLQILSTSNETSTGAELVQNGNFSEIGSDLVTNGDFSAGVEGVVGGNFESGLIGTVDNFGGSVYSWALNTVAPISGTQDGLFAITVNGTSNSYPRLGFDGGLELDKSYVLTFDYKVNSGITYFGSINRGGGSSEVVTTTLSGSGTYTYYFVAQGTGVLSLNFNGRDYLFNTQFDNVSIKELGEGWTFFGVDATNTISIESGGARVIAGDNISLRQTILEVGKSYKLTCNTTITSGALGLDSYTAGTTTNFTEGANVVYFTAASTLFIIKRITGADNVLIDNITVQEVGQDWTLGTGWSIGDTKAISTVTGSDSDITQSILTAGKTYRTVYEIVDYTAGTAQAIVTGSDGADAEAIETYTEDLTTTGTDFSIRSKLGTFDGSVSSVSVKQLGTYDDQSIYVTAADVQTIAQASVYYLVELTSMASRNSLYFLPSSVVPNNGRYTKLNFTVISKDALPQPTVGIISFYDSVGGFDTYPMGFYEFRIYEQTSSTNLDPLLATGLLEKGFAFVRDFSGNMQELTDGFKEYNPTLTQYVYSK